MEVEGGHQRKALVATYELVGTALFIYMILVSTGDALGVPLALFSMIVIFGGITGGHFNPAVTLGVFIHEGKWKENAGYAALIAVSQLVGSLLGMLLAAITLCAKVNGELTIPEHRVPVLAPTDPKGENAYDMATDSDGFSENWQTFITQVVCTFIFVAVILMLKGQLTGPSKDGVLIALTVALTLGGLIQVANHHAASFNPAVSLALTVFQTQAMENEGGYLTHYFYAYFVGPLLGGFLAGVFSRFHGPIHAASEDQKPAAREEEQNPLINN